MNYYQILGVPEDASCDAIRVAYIARLLELHPDNTRDYSIATKKLHALMDAYTTLRLPQLRKAYDLFLLNQSLECINNMPPSALRRLMSSVGQDAV